MEPLWRAPEPRVIMDHLCASVRAVFCARGRYSFTAIPGLALSCLRPSRLATWRAWLTLSAVDWAVFGIFVCGVMVLAATAQVHAIRALGPGGHAALQPLRLLSTMAASWLVLGEAVDGWDMWLGLATVIAALAWYLAVGRRPGTGNGAEFFAAGLACPCVAGDEAPSRQAPRSAREARARAESRRKRWWFERLIWPRPAFRPGKAPGSGAALFKDGNNQRPPPTGRDSGERGRRRRSPRGGGVRGDGDDGDDGDRGAPGRAGRAPGAASMLRSAADEAALDSDEDGRLLRGVTAAKPAVSSGRGAGLGRPRGGGSVPGDGGDSSDDGDGGGASASGRRRSGRASVLHSGDAVACGPGAESGPGGGGGPSAAASPAVVAGRRGYGGPDARSDGPPRRIDGRAAGKRLEHSSRRRGGGGGGGSSDGGSTGGRRDRRARDRDRDSATDAAAVSPGRR